MISEPVSYCVKIQTGSNGNNGGNQGYLSVAIKETLLDNKWVTTPAAPVKRDGWFDRNQIVYEQCFDDFEYITVQNKKTDAWAGTIIVRRNGVEVPLTCAGCGGSPFNKKIAVDGNSDGKDFAQTYCLNGKTCKLTLQGTVQE